MKTLLIIPLVFALQSCAGMVFETKLPPELGGGTLIVEPTK